MIDKIGSIAAHTLTYALWPVSTAAWAAMVLTQYIVDDIIDIAMEIWDERA